MKIDRNNPMFSSCRVLRPVRRRWFDPRRYLHPAEEALPHVLEADEETGQVACQLTNLRGEPLYVDAAGDTVALTDAVKVLLLNPETRREFARHYQPKVEVTYVPGLRIELRSVTPLGFQPRRPAPGAVMEQPVDGQTINLPAGSIY